MKRYLPYIMIAAGASLWGLIAFFVKGLREYGFTSMEIVGIRVIWAALFLVLIGLVKYRNEMKLKKAADLRYFIGTGIISIVFFNFCYFSAIDQMNISIAVILLYTSPAFVTILSFFFLKEGLTRAKLVAVAGTIIGCVLIAGVSTGSVPITFLGVLTGLGSALGYALYTIFGKFALERYQPFTVTLYTFGVAALALIPVTQLWQKSDVLFNGSVVLYGAGLGLLPTVVAFFLYTWGLEKTEGSKAAIIATVEPVVAMLLGVLLYGEVLEVIQMLGAILILASVIVVHVNFRKKKGSTDNESQIAQ